MRHATSAIEGRGVGAQRRLRVCNLHYSYYPAYSGARFFMEKIGSGLRRENIRMWTLSGAVDGLPGVVRHEGMPVVRVGPRRLRKYSPVLQLLLFAVASSFALLRLRRRYDIVLGQGFSLECALAVLLGMLLRKPVVLRLTLLGDKKRGGVRRLLGVLLRCADRLIVTNPGEHAFMRSAGFRAERTCIIPNGVDTEVFSPTSTDERAAIREQLRLTGGPVVAFTGGVIPRKGIECLLTAWPGVLREYPEARLVVLGPEHTDHPRLGAFNARIKLLRDLPGMKGSVIFLGLLSRSDVAKHLRSADLFVFPSEREGMPNALLEAMAVGLPCVVAPFVGMNDSIGRDGKELRIARAPSDLKSVILELMADADMRARLGTAARVRITECFQAARTVKSYAHLLHTTAHRRDWRSEKAWEGARLCIISQKRVWKSNEGIYSTGGFPRQVGALGQLCGRGLDLCVPVTRGIPPTGASRLAIEEGSLVALPGLDLGSISGRLAFIVLLPVILWRCWRAARSADAVHIRVPGYVGLAGLLAARASRRPRFAWVAAQWAQRIGSVARGRLRRVAGLTLDRLLRLLLGNTPTFSLGSTYVGQLPRVYPVISTSLWSADIPDDIPERTSSLPYTILYVGRLSREKGVTHLITAMGKLGRECPGRFRLVVVGEGPEGKSLQRHAESVGTADLVEWRGQVRVEDVFALYEKAHCLVLPSLSEASGKVLIEAMSRQCPVIATNVGGIPGIVADGQNGLLIPPSSPDELAKAIRRLQEEPGLASDLARRALDTARTNTLEAQITFMKRQLMNDWGGPCGH